MHIAQKAERHFYLNERLSTALEVVQKSPKDAAHAYIYNALVADAAAKSEQVNPRQLFQFQAPKTLFYALGIGVLALGLQFAPPLSLQKTTTQTPTLSQDEQRATVTQLERITNLVQRDAERTNDPYLQATVRSLEQLKAQIQSGQLTAPLAQQELARLSEQIEKGYNLSSSTQSNSVNRSTNNAQNPVSSNPQNIPNSNQPNTNVQTAQSGQPGSSSSQRLENLARQLQAKSEQTQGQSTAPNPQSQSQQADCTGAACSDIYAKARAEQAKAAEAPKNQINRPQGGAAGGFGDQAGKDAGGKSGARGTTPRPRTKAEQVKLPFQAPPSGRRIQILGPSSSSSPSAVTGTVEAQNWTRQEEVPIGLGYLSAPNRSVVSNYFTPSKETP
jgi:hypothetical protein